MFKVSVPFVDIINAEMGAWKNDYNKIIILNEGINL